jgi:hypothetical protein
MRDFSKVSPAVWESDRFWSLPNDSDRLCYHYVITNAHINSGGCYKLPSGYAAHDLRRPVEQFEASRGALIAAGLIEYDEKTRELYVLRWFRHNAPTTLNHFTGAMRQIERIESPTLRQKASDEATAAWEAWQADHPPKGHRPASGNDSGLASISDGLRRKIEGKSQR